MQKLITTLHLTLGSLQSCKKEVWNICDFNTQQGEGIDVLRHINYVETTIYDLLYKVNEINQRVKYEESSRCIKCKN